MIILIKIGGVTLRNECNNNKMKSLYKLYWYVLPIYSLFIRGFKNCVSVYTNCIRLYNFSVQIEVFHTELKSVIFYSIMKGILKGKYKVNVKL